MLWFVMCAECDVVLRDVMQVFQIGKEQFERVGTRLHEALRPIKIMQRRLDRSWRKVALVGILNSNTANVIIDKLFSQNIFIFLH